MNSQHRRARALVEMLAAAAREDIPLVSWTVSAATGSCLHGEVDAVLDRCPQATFVAWVRFLGLRVNASGDRAAGPCPADRGITVGLYNPRPATAGGGEPR